MFTDQYPADKPIHICKECGFEIESNGHSPICPFYTYKSWQDFNTSEQKTILEESAKQGASDQDKKYKKSICTCCKEYDDINCPVHC